jgi:hypothetical protein
VEAIQRHTQQAIAGTANAAQIVLCFRDVSRALLNFGAGVRPDNPARERLNLFR